jgi:hypothetical protein
MQFLQQSEQSFLFLSIKMFTFYNVAEIKFPKKIWQKFIGDNEQEEDQCVLQTSLVLHELKNCAKAK